MDERQMQEKWRTKLYQSDSHVNYSILHMISRESVNETTREGEKKTLEYLNMKKPARFSSIGRDDNFIVMVRVDCIIIIVIIIIVVVVISRA